MSLYAYGAPPEHGNAEFLDSVAVGLITPGPVVITAAFAGYLAAHVRKGLVFTNTGLLVMTAILGAATVGFLDDYLGNVEAARRVGMFGILVETDPAGALAELDQLLERGRRIAEQLVLDVEQDAAPTVYASKANLYVATPAYVDPPKPATSASHAPASEAM